MSQVQSNLRFCSVLCALLSAPLSASAQTAHVDARAQLHRGVAALRRSRFTEAIEALEASIAERPSPPAIYNLGFAYSGVGRHYDAIGQFERWLVHPSHQASRSAIAAVRTEAERLRATLLSIAITPPDASVRIDGRSTPTVNGSASLDPGQHAVDVISAGFVPMHRDEVFEPGGHLVIALQPLQPVPVAAPLEVVAAQWILAIAPTAPSTPHPRIAEPPTQGRSWVLPVVIASGVLVVVAGVTAGVLINNNALVTPPAGTWGQLSTR